jgi:hypothetical protein
MRQLDPLTYLDAALIIGFLKGLNVPELTKAK